MLICIDLVLVVIYPLTKNLISIGIFKFQLSLASISKSGCYQHPFLKFNCHWCPKSNSHWHLQSLVVTDINFKVRLLPEPSSKSNCYWHHPSEVWLLPMHTIKVQLLHASSVRISEVIDAYGQIPVVTGIILHKSDCYRWIRSKSSYYWHYSSEVQFLLMPTVKV